LNDPDESQSDKVPSFKFQVPSNWNAKITALAVEGTWHEYALDAAISESLVVKWQYGWLKPSGIRNSIRCLKATAKDKIPMNRTRLCKMSYSLPSALAFD